MNPISVTIRNRFHPLLHLRKFAVYRWLTRAMDRPVWIRIPSISHPVRVSLSKHLSLVLSRGKAVEENERVNFLSLITMSGVHRFADVGANIGVYGFTFLSTVKSCSVTLIEPDQDNIRLLRQTINNSGITNIKLVEAAASEADGFATFYADDLSGTTGSLLRGSCDPFNYIDDHREPRQERVRCVALDTLFEEKEAPDFIKIDVEGAELKVLRGAEHLISKTKPLLFFECDANQSEVHAFLSQRGYIFFDFSSMKPVDELPHNCLALHIDLHRHLIDSFAKCKQVGM